MPRQDENPSKPFDLLKTPSGSETSGSTSTSKPIPTADTRTLHPQYGRLPASNPISECPCPLCSLCRAVAGFMLTGVSVNDFHKIDGTPRPEGSLPLSWPDNFEATLAAPLTVQGSFVYQTLVTIKLSSLGRVIDNQFVPLRSPEAATSTPPTSLKGSLRRTRRKRPSGPLQEG